MPEFVTLRWTKLVGGGVAMEQEEKTAAAAVNDDGPVAKPAVAVCFCCYRVPSICRI